MQEKRNSDYEIKDRVLDHPLEMSQLLYELSGDERVYGSYTVGYLGIISLSGFANSERFLLPGIIGLIIMWAYGVSILNAKSMKFVKAWYVIVVLMEVGWAYFKIGSRGML